MVVSDTGIRKAIREPPRFPTNVSHRDTSRILRVETQLTYIRCIFFRRRIKHCRRTGTSCPFYRRQKLSKNASLSAIGWRGHVCDIYWQFCETVLDILVVDVDVDVWDSMFTCSPNSLSLSAIQQGYGAVHLRIHHNFYNSRIFNSISYSSGKNVYL